MKRHALEKASIATTQTPLPAPLWHDREDIIQRLCGLKECIGLSRQARVARARHPRPQTHHARKGPGIGITRKSE